MKNNRSRHAFLALVVFGAACLGGLVATDLHAQSIPLWSRAIFAHPSDGFGKEHRFSLRFFKQEGLHITGRCTYYQVDNQTPAVATIEGTKTEDGTFWPDVTSQVLNEETGKWETISKPFNHGHRGSVTIKPGEANHELLVSLDVFLPLVGKYKTGKLILNTGETAEFDLYDLLEDK
jgi:hypothetical protein